MSRKLFLVHLLLVLSLTLLARSAVAQTIVPTGLEGKGRLEAIVILQASGFRVTLQDEASCTEPGIVSSVTPAGGTLVTADPPRVTLGISVGGVDQEIAVSVPRLVGMTFVEAENALLALNLQVVDKRNVDEPGWCPIGTGRATLIDSVTGTVPAKDTLVCPGTKVQVHRRVEVIYSYPEPGKDCP